MRFHVVSLPHTQTTREYVHCAYTEKVRKFCDMMMSLGHEVFLYASEDNEAVCTELITVISKKEQRDLIGINSPTDNLKASFDPEAPYWKLMNQAAIDGIKKRAQPKDFICLIAGLCQKQIADALPEMMSVEFGVGYGGVFASYRVFESYAWMHTVYGALSGSNAHDADGRWYDTVIPNYYEVDQFDTFKQDYSREDYFLYVGRLIDRKGYHIAQEVCEKLGKRLIVAGQGEFSGYGEYIGTVNTRDRNELMSKAQAVFVPSQYLEPFGGVHVEALLNGVPVITTDWGVFTETVQNGVNGYRCRTFDEFLHAARDMQYWGIIKRLDLKEAAVKKFGTDHVRWQYHSYFERLLTLWDEGWYTTN
jgi:glycosyltransferase involved in cell wall biosynthesis